MPWFRRFVADSERVDVRVDRQRATGEARETFLDVLPLLLRGRTRDRLVVAIAPAFTIGFMVRRALSSTAITESNGSPVLFTPSRSRAASWPMAWQTSAKTNGFDTLWMEKLCSASPSERTWPRTLATQMPNRSGDAFANAGM